MVVYEREVVETVGGVVVEPGTEEVEGGLAELELELELTLEPELTLELELELETTLELELELELELILEAELELELVPSRVVSEVLSRRER